jgi:cobalt/nickel transport system permease protein
MVASGATQLDRHAYLDSWVHRLDPRAKLLATLLFVLVVASFPKYAVAPLLVFALYPLALAILGDVPPRLILVRLLWISPFVLFVGILNPVFDRQPMARIGGLTVSAGWVSFASIVVRFALTVGAALALAATTPFPVLCRALARLRAPRVLVVQMLFLYRYLFVLTDEGARMVRARELRAGGRRRGRSVRVASAMLAVLFTRTIDRAERVYQAMLARGFRDEVRTLTRIRWRPADTAFLLTVTAFSIGFRLYPLNDLLARIGQGIL